MDNVVVSGEKMTIANPATFNQGSFKTDEATKIKKLKGIFGSLHKRMDQDRDLYRLKPYVFKNLEGQTVKEADNVTLNAPALYADKVQSSLLGAYRTVKVEGKIEEKQKDLIEDFCDAVELDIDSSLEKMGEASLYPFLIEQSCLRGREAVRVAMVEKGGKLVLDVMPYDTRYFVHKFSRDGLLYAASFSNRSKEDIKDEYNFDAKSATMEVTDYWDMKYNKIWVRDNEFHSFDHNLEFTPIAFNTVPAGSMLKDDDNLKYRGESLYRNSRALFPELNKTATILQSLNVMQFRPALQRASLAGEQAAPVNEYPHGSGKVTNVEITGGIRAMPIADIHSATRLFYSSLESYLQRATLPAIDYGNLSFPLSAVALTKLTENKDQIFIPRLHSIAKMYKQIMMMAIKLLIFYEGDIELGAEGHKKKFNYKDLEGGYLISYLLESKSPEQDIANYAIAEHAMNFLDVKTVLTDILKVKHPTQIMDNRRVNMAEKLDPAIGLFRGIHAAVEAAGLEPGKYIEARMMMDRLAGVIAQRHAPQASEGSVSTTEQSLSEDNRQAQPGAQGQGYLPLFGGGQGGARKSTVEAEQ